MAEHASVELTAGWKKDPFGRHFGRYWDGERWTDHVISAETVPGIDPAGRRSPDPERAPAQGAGTGPASQERLGSWQKDPSGRHSSRYWDGWHWTDHVMSAERVPELDPLPLPSPDTQPARAGVRAATAPTKVMPVSGSAGSPGSSRPLPLRAWGELKDWPRPVWSALGATSVIAGLIAIGAAISSGGSRPVLGNGATTIPGAVVTTAPSAAVPLATTIPIASQAPPTVPTAPADPGVPATTPGTVPGSQPAVDPPVTVPEPGESTTASSMTTTS